MFTKKGKAQGAFTLLGGGLSALVAASAAQAALVTVSGIFTNNTAGVVTKEFSQKMTVTETVDNPGFFSNLSLVVTDFNRNGAQLSGISCDLLINGSNKLSWGPGGSFTVNAPARSLATYDGLFGTAAAPIGLDPAIYALRPNDEIEIRMRMNVSAGDQVAYTATMNMVNLVSVPGPGAACMALLAPWIGLHRRRRAENDT